MKVNIHEIKLQGKYKFTKKFNHCSELYAKAFDESLPKEQQDEAWESFIQARIRLEMGM